MSTPATKTLPLATALGQSEPLNSLLRRLHDSRERLATVAALLPDSLRPAVRPGPLDDAGWVLLVVMEIYKWAARRSAGANSTAH